MGATAELDREIATHTEHANFVAILFTKQGHCTFSNRIIHTHHISVYLCVTEYFAIDHLFNLASLLSDQGKYVEAEPLSRRALQGYEAELGATHPDTLASVNSLAGFLLSQARLIEALALKLRRLQLDATAAVMCCSGSACCCFCPCCG